MNILKRTRTSNIKPNLLPETDPWLSQRSVTHRFGTELVLLALAGFIQDQRMYNISILEIENGIVLQGVAKNDDHDYGEIGYLKTFVLSEADLRLLIDRLR